MSLSSPRTPEATILDLDHADVHLRAPVQRRFQIVQEDQELDFLHSCRVARSGRGRQLHILPHASPLQLTQTGAVAISSRREGTRRRRRQRDDGQGAVEVPRDGCQGDQEPSVQGPRRPHASTIGSAVPAAATRSKPANSFDFRSPGAQPAGSSDQAAESHDVGRRAGGATGDI